MKRLLLVICLFCFLCCSCKFDQTNQSSKTDTSSIPNESSNLEKNNINSIDNLSNELKGYLSYDWLSAYSEYSDSGFFEIDTDFYLIDLDDDGTYELLRCMHFNSQQGGNIMYIYYYVDNHIVCLGQIYSGAITDDYKDYFEVDGMPAWLSENVIDIYKNKSDGTFRYLSRDRHCGGRELFVYFDIFSIVENKITTSEIDGYAAYTIFKDNATVYDKWYFKIADNYTELVSDWEQYINKQLDGYDLYAPSKKTLHAEFDCSKWISLYKEDKGELENAYNLELSKLIEKLNAQVK